MKKNVSPNALSSLFKVQGESNIMRFSNHSHHVINELYHGNKDSNQKQLQKMESACLNFLSKNVAERLLRNSGTLRYQEKEESESENDFEFEPIEDEKSMR